MTQDYLRWVRKDVLCGQPYQPSQSGFGIKLDAMESPYPLPPELDRAWHACLADAAVNRYPEADPVDLKRALMRHAGVPGNCSLLLGNGSDELLQIVTLALRGGCCLLSPEPGFAVYRMAAMIARMDYRRVPLNPEDFSLDRRAMLAAVKQHQPVLTCLAQPNNPTGNLFDETVVEEIIAAVPGYVLLDEAYEPFASRHGMDLLNKFSNVLILRTFSKIGFAGLRFGFLAGREDLIAEFNKLRLPYNVGLLPQRGIKFVLQHFEAVQKQVDEIRRLRGVFFDELRAIRGVTVFPSETNFILFRVAAGYGSLVFEELKRRDILIKDLSSADGLEDCLRVTVGAEHENRRFLDEVKDILHG